MAKVEFYDRVVEAGTGPKLYVKIHALVGNDVVDREATPEDTKRFRKEFTAYVQAGIDAKHAVDVEEAKEADAAEKDELIAAQAAEIEKLKAELAAKAPPTE